VAQNVRFLNTRRSGGSVSNGAAEHPEEVTDLEPF
jgi:hypothetical protein